MASHEKIGRPSIEEEGVKVELGEPVVEEQYEKETIEATLTVIKEALQEFYILRQNHDKGAATVLQVMRDAERPYVFAGRALEHKDADARLALAILEAVRGELQLERSILESDDQDVGHGIQEKREANLEKDAHYQEAADVLYSRDRYGVPDRPEFIEWLSATKEVIKKLAKEEEEKYKGIEPGEGPVSIFRSRFLTDVPAIERFEFGKETTRDYNEIMNLVESRLLSYRDEVGTLVLQWASEPEPHFTNEMAKNLLEIRKLELFLSRLEGEQNERIAKRLP